MPQSDGQEKRSSGQKIVNENSRVHHLLPCVVMSHGSFWDNSRRGSKLREEGYDSIDSRQRNFKSSNGAGIYENPPQEKHHFFDRKERYRSDSRDHGIDKAEEDSDEEGEVKEAGATRDLRDEIEAKSGRRQGSSGLGAGLNREVPKVRPMGMGAPFFNGTPAIRRDPVPEEPPEMMRRGEMGRNISRPGLVLTITSVLSASTATEGMVKG